LKPWLTDAERSSLAVLIGLLAAGYLVVAWRAWREPEGPPPVDARDVAFIQQAARLEVGETPAEPLPDGKAQGRARKAPGGPVDINRADSLGLLAVPGLGPVKVGALLARRRALGPFTSVEDLLKVKGIGPATLDKLRGHVRITQAVSAPPARPESPAAPPGAK
jgi:competence ComEA-like helix-hairpin-helix protein